MHEYEPLKSPAAKAQARINGSKTVRNLFLIGAFIMVITLPFVSSTLSVPLFFSLVAILLIESAAGLTASAEKGMAVVNALIAMITFAGFEFSSVRAYIQSESGGLFWVNQILAINFFFAFYYSVKVLRKILWER